LPALREGAARGGVVELVQCTGRTRVPGAIALEVKGQEAR